MLRDAVPRAWIIGERRAEIYRKTGNINSTIDNAINY